MPVDLRKRLGSFKTVKVCEDGSRIVEYENGRRMRLSFRVCDTCGVNQPETNFVRSLGSCFSCTSNFYSSARYQRQLEATPPWVNKSEIKKFYDEAKRLTKETGIPHHVDHIWPITHEAFCGLHVPWNLRVIPMKHNLAKKNQPPLDYLHQIN